MATTKAGRLIFGRVSFLVPVDFITIVHTWQILTMKKKQRTRRLLSSTTLWKFWKGKQQYFTQKEKNRLVLVVAARSFCWNHSDKRTIDSFLFSTRALDIFNVPCYSEHRNSQTFLLNENLPPESSWRQLWMRIDREWALIERLNKSTRSTLCVALSHGKSLKLPPPRGFVCWQIS